MKEGDRARFFDAVAWHFAGKDIGDNDQFFMPATIITLYKVDHRQLADIKFDHKEIVSKAYFVGRSYQRPLEYRSDLK